MVARIMKTNGSVLLKRLGNQFFEETATQGMSINNGDAIKVGEQSFAAIIYLDDRSVVKIRENTQFQFMDTRNTRTLNIEVGTILNDVKKIGRTKTFRVQTPVSVASVKGTKFIAVVDVTGVDQFFGVEGIVEVFNLVSGRTVSLTAGQKVISNAMGNLVQAPASPNEYPQDPYPDEEPELKEPKEKIKKPEKTPQPREIPKKQPGSETIPKKEPVPDKKPKVTTPEKEVKKITETPSKPKPTTQVISKPEKPVKTPPEPEKEPIGLGLGIGSVTIDGKMYNQFALRPELTFGKLGIGLDLVLYIDNEGNFWNDTWDFKNDPGLILDKILFIRWGQKSDPLWFKWGSLENITLGYGGLMSGYSNMMEFPSVRRVGVNVGLNMANFSSELLLTDIKDFARGGTLIGLRGSYLISKTLPLTIGANLIVDMNQFSGLIDKDDDSYPDIFDDFPDDKTLWNDTDGDGIPDYHVGVQEPENGWDIDADQDNQLDTLAGGSDIPTVKKTPFSIRNNVAKAIGFTLDIGYPIISNKVLSLIAYSEFNSLKFPEVNSDNFNRPEKTGIGISIPGIRISLMSIFKLSLEYRIKRDYFVQQFFDQSYDLNRVVADYEGVNSVVKTKDIYFFEDPATKINTSGWFGAASLNIFNLVDLSASYTNMVANDVEFNSFYAQVNLNTDNIPKLSVASAYYQRNNDANPFDFGNPSVNTVLGYRLGYSISKGVSLIWDYRQFYRDAGNGLEAVKQTSIETAFSF